MSRTQSENRSAVSGLPTRSLLFARRTIRFDKERLKTLDQLRHDIVHGDRPKPIDDIAQHRLYARNRPIPLWNDQATGATYGSTRRPSMILRANLTRQMSSLRWSRSAVGDDVEVPARGLSAGRYAQSRHGTLAGCLRRRQTIQVVERRVRCKQSQTQLLVFGRAIQMGDHAPVSPDCLDRIARRCQTLPPRPKRQPRRARGTFALASRLNAPGFSSP